MEPENLDRVFAGAAGDTGGGVTCGPDTCLGRSSLWAGYPISDVFLCAVRTFDNATGGSRYWDVAVHARLQIDLSVVDGADASCRVLAVHSDIGHWSIEGSMAIGGRQPDVGKDDSCQRPPGGWLGVCWSKIWGDGLRD